MEQEYHGGGTMIKSNLLEVHENMKKACEKAGRSAQRSGAPSNAAR